MSPSSLSLECLWKIVKASRSLPFYLEIIQINPFTPHHLTRGSLQKMEEMAAQKHEYKIHPRGRCSFSDNTLTGTHLRVLQRPIRTINVTYIDKWKIIDIQLLICVIFCEKNEAFITIYHQQRRRKSATWALWGCRRRRSVDTSSPFVASRSSRRKMIIWVNWSLVGAD